MKYLITLLSIILLGCGRDAPSINFVVKKIVCGSGRYCKYIGDGRTTAPFATRAMIYDTCGKFNIGDTIKFVK